MLKNLGGGWAEITIDNKKICNAGYITDVPNDFLCALKDALEGKSSVVSVHLEPGDVFFIFAIGFDTNMILIKTENDSIYVKSSIKELANELIVDIETDLENWSDFMRRPKEKDNYKKTLLENLQRLKVTLKNK